MRENDGRRLDHATLETIRLQAVRAVADGERPAAVAKNLGMSRTAVYAWLAQVRAGGPEALAAKPIPGRPPMLSVPQVRRIHELLVVEGDPRAVGFRSNALWTRELVGELIRRTYEVQLSLSSVERLLGSLHLSCPRSAGGMSATLRAEAAAAGAEIDLLTTVPHHSVMFRGTLFSARSAAGWRRFAVLPGPLSPATCLAFFPRLLDDAGRPVLLVVADHPVYNAPEVEAYVGATKGRLRLMHLPSAPLGRDPGA
jgi:transposase